MRLSPRLLLGAALLAFTVGAATLFFISKSPGLLEGGVRSAEYLTPSVKVDGIYPSMLGPTNTDTDIRLSKSEPELLWITGYRADMVGPDISEPRSAEFMCHNTLSIHDTEEVHRKVLGSGTFRSRRLFTLSQGQSVLDFPEGFGIPVSSAERLMLQSQVLNLRQERIGTEVRHKVSTTFISEREAGRSMQALALIPTGIALDVLDEQAREMPDNPLSCAVDAGGQKTFHKGGKERTTHWVVHPGPETKVNFLGRVFPYDTTVHYVAIHMHAYGQSLELRDVTENKSIYKALCQSTPDGDGLARVDFYSSAKGFPVWADHEYELISHYNNTSDKDQTAMAFMLLYVKDVRFRKPDPTALAGRSDEFCSKSPASYTPQAEPSRP